MKKYTKGAIAAGAATLLLLGGFGTFALWNDSKDLDAGTLATGRLSIGDPTPGDWYRAVDEPGNPGTRSTDPADYAAETPLNMATFTIVPEDELVYIVEDVEVTAEGGALYFRVSATLGATLEAWLATAAGDPFTVSTPILTGDDEITSAPAGDGEFVGVPEDAVVYAVNATDGVTVETFTAVIPVAFDADDLVAQDIEVDLTEAALLVDQVVADPAYIP